MASIQVPGTPWATPPGELEKLAGYGRDIGKARDDARRLLREAGIPDGYAFTLKNRAIPQPYEPIGIWLIDQWRQIGLNVKQEFVEAGAYYTTRRNGDFSAAVDFQCSFVVEPDIDIAKFQSIGVSDSNYARYKDPVLDDLYLKQSRALDPEERRRALRASSAASWTRRCATSTRCSGTASCPTARRRGAGPSRLPTSSTSSSTRCGWRSVREWGGMPRAPLIVFEARARISSSVSGTEASHAWRRPRHHLVPTRRICS